MLERLTPQNIKKLKGRIFDMDGTLINSEPLHIQAIEETIKTYNEDRIFSQQQLVELCVGKSDTQAFKELYPYWDDERIAEAVERKNEKFLKVLEESSSEAIKKLLTPGIEAYLEKMNQSQRDCFVITASEQSIVTPLLSKAGILEFFTEVRSRNDSFRTKPSGSPYLSLMRKYGLQTSQTVIFEDSPTGLQAALETGAYVIHVTTHCGLDVQRHFKDLQQSDNFHWLISAED